MIKMLTILFLAGLTSCSLNSADKTRINNKIHFENAKSFEEIRSHFQQVINAHPELNDDARTKIGLLLDQAIEKQIALKDQESQVIQVLLKKSLSVNTLTATELKDKKSLKHRLTEIYELKANNIFLLVSNLKEVLEKTKTDETLEQEMVILFREFR
jgi:hypothetical protein